MIFQKLKSLFSFQKPSRPESPKQTIKEGVIKFFNKKKGFGFIRSTQTAKDVFVHVQDLKDRIRKGDRVVFQVEENEKGLRARNVELVSA